MQKDLTSAAEALAEGLNDMHQNKTKTLINLVKKQAEEIDKRGEIINHLQETMKMQQNSINSLVAQAKHLEALVEDMRNERQKLVEELELLKKPKRQTRSKKTKEKDGDASEAA